MEDGRFCLHWSFNAFSYSRFSCRYRLSKVQGEQDCEVRTRRMYAFGYWNLAPRLLPPADDLSTPGDADEMAAAPTDGSHAAYLSSSLSPSTTLLLAPELWTLLLEQLNTQDPVEPSQLSVAVSARFPTASAATKAGKSLSNLVVFARQADASFLRNLGKEVRRSSKVRSEHLLMLCCRRCKSRLRSLYLKLSAPPTQPSSAVPAPPRKRLSRPSYSP